MDPLDDTDVINFELALSDITQIGVLPCWLAAMLTPPTQPHDSCPPPPPPSTHPLTHPPTHPPTSTYPHPPRLAERRLERLKKTKGKSGEEAKRNEAEAAALERIMVALEKGQPARSVALAEEEEELGESTRMASCLHSVILPVALSEEELGEIFMGFVLSFVRSAGLLLSLHVSWVLSSWGVATRSRRRWRS